MYEEIAEQQADITRLLLHHIHAPLTDTDYLRGVLPVPPPDGAIRVAIGAKEDHAPEQLLAYEIPVRQGDDLVTAYDVIGILRTLLTGTHLYSSDSVSTLMGMTLVRANLAAVEPAEPTPDDNALTILRTIVSPCTEEQPDPRLRGFLFLGQDRLRLYLDTEDVPGVIAADVRPSGAVTALLAALPSLITEEERMVVDSSDPHCSCVVDLTYW
ncbi:hypothetical protein GCM10015535_12880 [Streptomyces gelaticus]|uniref:Uncharacterized protein n=1 Tax=Streptomyces gelaticus TaxID=285446 RepID=A0ABQ2VVS8_9ACTN|nr:hypothetical protein [Streptomyces gelaticus]GGV78296.1 hypothetical protein GCM10015535_12880 [Streptomyces gelaticus]